MKYKIGTILETTADQELDGEFGDKYIVPKGTKMIIGPDKFAYHVNTGKMQPLRDTDEVEGYNTEGLAGYIYFVLKNRFEIDEMLEEHNNSPEDFIKYIAYALDEIGFKEE